MGTHTYTPAICEYCHNPFPARTDALQHGQGRFCSMSCASHAMHASQRGTMEEEFWTRVLKTETCWLWTGHVTVKGYGHFQYAGNVYSAHRMAYELVDGPIPTGQLTCHTCDVRNCVRNDDRGFYRLGDLIVPRIGHLFLGTDKTNLQDAAAKGRMGLGSRNGKHTHPELILRGTAHPRAKLTPDAVRFIRANRGKMTQTAMALMFDVPQTTISAVQLRRVWTHVTD